MFEASQTFFGCSSVSVSQPVNKHRSAVCYNSNFNLTVTLDLHSLPFCTTKTPHQSFQPFTSRMDTISANEKVIIVLHIFAHLLNYHSHVYLESVREMKSAVVKLLGRNEHAFVVVKGPHSYSFSKSTDHVIWMPDAYAQPYDQFLREEFKDLHDRVVYINALDITIATEQWFIHPENFVVKELVARVLDFFC